MLLNGRQQPMILALRTDMHRVSETLDTLLALVAINSRRLASAQGVRLKTIQAHVVIKTSMR